jgi:hypothetical protein
MNYLQAILKKLEGQREIEMEDLNVYITTPVGVGEHANIGEEIEKKVENIDALDSKIETINKILNS